MLIKQTRVPAVDNDLTARVAADPSRRRIKVKQALPDHHLTVVDLCRPVPKRTWSESQRHTANRLTRCPTAVPLPFGDEHADVPRCVSSSARISCTSRPASWPCSRRPPCAPRRPRIGGVGDRTQRTEPCFRNLWVSRVVGCHWRESARFSPQAGTPGRCSGRRTGDRAAGLAAGEKRGRRQPQRDTHTETSTRRSLRSDARIRSWPGLRRGGRSDAAKAALLQTLSWSMLWRWLSASACTATNGGHE
jgi:hypothetical protein